MKRQFLRRIHQECPENDGFAVFDFTYENGEVTCDVLFTCVDKPEHIATCKKCAKDYNDAHHKTFNELAVQDFISFRVTGK